jgi:glutamate--cysteine ligase
MLTINKQDISSIIIQNHLIIETWLREYQSKFSPLITCSVDLRNSLYKISPVDTNLFPAGFNNLSEQSHALAVQAFQSVIQHEIGSCRRILLIPESHTRNVFYYESLAKLRDIIFQAGYEVKIGSLLLEAGQDPTEVALPSGRHITLSPLMRENDRIQLADFDPCVVILNNDLSAGVPDILKNIKQRITPSVDLGWYQRSKYKHFDLFSDVVIEFAKLINIDPWLIVPEQDYVDNFDVYDSESIELLAKKTQALLDKIQRKYTEYHIPDKPFIFMKADAGTYGMGVIPIIDAQEIYSLNRKEKQNMAVRKGNQQVDRVLIQEGVYTYEQYGELGSVAEPVIYLFGHQVIGGFYRVHQKKGVTENLNAPGMAFEPIAFQDCCNTPDPDKPVSHLKNKYYVYGVIARLASIAARLEQGCYQ